MTQGQLVSGISSLLTGPATARIIDFGLMSVVSWIEARRASSIDAKFLVWTIGNWIAGLAASGTTANRALVPPMSPITIGNANAAKLPLPRMAA